MCQELKYSSGSAYRRIQAMRLLKDMPELEEKLTEGSINLTTATQVQSFLFAQKKANEAKVTLFINKENEIQTPAKDLLAETRYKEHSPISKEEKQELLKHLENKSTREVENIY